MRQPCYINLEQARQVLAEMGVELNQRQMETEENAYARVFNEATTKNDPRGAGDE